MIAEHRNGQPLPFLFLDLETTGHDTLKRVRNHLIPWHEIIEVGAVMTPQPSFEELGYFSVKVHPEHPERCLPDLINHYPERAANGEWADAMPLQEALLALFGWCRMLSPNGVVVPIGQNFTFDWSFLSVAFAWHGIPEQEWSRYFHYGRLDTRSMSVQELWEPGTPYVPGDYSLRNDTLATTLGIAPEPVPHLAVNGARKSLEVCRRLRERKEERRG